jgi:4-amino-4-deoxy-L-arabinose transferase-like glycosyltransferase
MQKSVLWSTFIFFGLTLVIGLYLRSESWIGTTVLRPLQSDASDYFNYAYNLRNHQTYSREKNPSPGGQFKPAPDAVRSPGYPLMLSFLIDGPPDRKLIKKIQLFQTIFSTLTLVFAFFLFRSLMPPFHAGIAALLTAISPHLIVFNSYILSETMFCFSLVLSGFLVTHYARRPTRWFSTLLGIVMGVATLIRPSLQFFPLVVALILLFHYRYRAGSKLALALMLGFLLTVAPWYARNMVTLGRLSDNSLMVNFLHHGLYPYFKYKAQPDSYRRPYKYDPRSKEISRSVGTVLKEIARRFKTEPASHFKWYLAKKPAVFWSWHTVQGHGDMFIYYIADSPYYDKPIFKWTHRLMRMIHGPLVVMCLIGCLLVWIFPGPAKNNPAVLLISRIIAALLLYFTGLHMIGAPFPRYSVPLRPFQYGMALYCLYIIYDIVKTRRVNL